MNLEKCGLKIVGSRHFFLSNFLWNKWHTIVITGVSMKKPKDINCVLVEWNSFLKSPRQMKVCIVMIYIQEHIPDNEEIIKYSMFQWRLLVIQKLMISWMILFYVYKSLSLYNRFLETFHTNNQTILNFSKYMVQRSSCKYQLSRHCQSNVWVSWCKY